MVRFYILKNREPNKKNAFNKLSCRLFLKNKIKTHKKQKKNNK